MILVDTNILIDFLKNPTKEKESIFQENEITDWQSVKAKNRVLH